MNSPPQDSTAGSRDRSTVRAVRCESCASPLVAERIGPSSTLLRCPACGHVIRDMQLSGGMARSHAWGGNSAFDKLRLALTWRRLTRSLPRGRRLSVLEIGFGAGTTLSKFLDRGDEISGVERNLLDIGVNPRVAAEGTLYQSAAEDVTLPPDHFDLIYAIHVVEHLTDPAAVFAKMFRALRPGGRFYCITPNSESRGLAVFGESWWNLEDPTHCRFFSRRSLSHMLGGAGFEKVRTGVVVEDSLTLEVNSLLRALSGHHEVHGVLHSRTALAASALLTPVGLLARAALPSLSPSIEAWATRS